jgi:phosphoribosyl 1,2-cyclic phosphate phosphodiesterase
MKLHLLGTGGAEGVPGFFADSRVSHHARLHGGKDIRTRSAAVLDDEIKIDLPPDTFAQMVRDGLSAMDWSALVFTHGHDDHVACSEIQYALYPFTPNEVLPFTIYANPQVSKKIWDRYPAWPLDLVETHSFESFQHAGYTITPIHANHKEDEDSQNLIFDDGRRKLLYGTDTGIWPAETWEFLTDWTIDLLVLECGEGFKGTPYHGHLDVYDLVRVVNRLREMGVLHDASRVITTHHGHMGDGLHSEYEEALNPYGVEVGFDGMVVEF